MLFRSKKLSFFRVRTNLDQSKEIYEKLGIKSLLDLGAGNNPHKEIRNALNIKEYLIDVHVEDPQSKIYIEANFMDFNRMSEIILTHIGELPEAVVGLHVIEHVSKSESRLLIKNMQQWASKVIILETPNGFVLQPGTASNPYQEHLCGWKPNELRELGFKVKGSTGMKFLRNNFDKGSYKINLKFIRYLDVFLSRWLGLNRIPSLSFNLFRSEEHTSELQSH